MAYGISLQISGDYALFTRPEMKGERVSYDVITPSAARGVIEAIYWHKGLRWKVDRITVLNEIKFDSVRRNELGSKISYRNVKSVMNGADYDLHQYIQEDRQQRASLLLRDVSYIIDAHFELIPDNMNTTDSAEKFYNIFLRRARNGQCYHQPYLGCREFAASFQLIENELPPKSVYSDEESRDLGWMLWDIEYIENPKMSYNPKFFRATMRNGVIDVPAEVTL